MKLKLHMNDIAEAINKGQDYHADAMLREARKQIKAGVPIEVHNDIFCTTTEVTTEADLDKLVDFVAKIKNIKER